MSFRCQNCKNVVAHNIPQAMVVTQTREKRYTNSLLDNFGNVRKTIETVGSEIVREIPCCPDCEQKLTGKCSHIRAEDKQEDLKKTVFTNTSKISVPVEYVTGLPSRKN